ncbi:MAG: chemotaxis protein CheW [Leptolyngbyaceae cyanobacterium MO_188.B28]|nr:chemotaxis protein CheW [Leptolyngbyaceae cyanobacterium MO_188.B28]
MLTSSDSALIATNSLDALVLDPKPPETRQRLLRFPLGSHDSALLPLAQITEILRIDIADILTVPETPHCVLGICNWRGDMLWLIDLNDLVSSTPLFELELGVTAVMVIVVQINGQAVGLGLPQVHDIEFHNLERLQPTAPGLFSPQLQPFVLGTLPGVVGAVLNLAAIAQCPLWQETMGGAP